MPSEDRQIRPRRSVLFVSALKPEAFDDARASGADLVCVDLEDAVPPERKDEGRDGALPLFARCAPEDRVQVLVRMNTLRSADGLKDMLAFLGTPTPPPAIMLPKVDTAAEVRWADELLAGARRPVDLYVIIESNHGLANVHEIAASTPRLKGLFFGGFDMSAALGARPDWEPLLYARGRAAHAAASAGVDILDSPWQDLGDEAGLVASAEAARNLGFAGKCAKDARQIAAINRVFTPDRDTVARAESILAMFEKDPSAPLVVDGKLIERPAIRTLQRVVAVARATGGA